MANDTLTIPPPPDVESAVPSVPHTTAERVIGGIGSRAVGVANALSGLSGSSMHPFEESSVGKALGQHYSDRLAQARRHYENAQTYGNVLGSGEIDPQTGEPSGIDPQTGKPLTPDQRAQYKQMAEGAWADYQKIAGTSKEVKQSLQTKKALFDVLVNKGHKALAGLLDAHGKATGQGGGAQGGGGGAQGAPQPAQQPGSMSPPPSPNGAADGPAAAAAGQSGASAIPPPPAPPAYNDQSASQAPRLRQEMADNRAMDLERRKQQVISDAKIREDEAKARAEAKAKSEFPPAAKTGVAPKVLSSDGVPYAVERVGADGKSRIVTKDDPEFTAADQRILDAAAGAKAASDKDKAKLTQDRMNSYINARAVTQQYGVIDKTTGEPVMVNARMINANPGRYGPGSLTQQLKNRAGIFDEIDATKEQFNAALDKLTDADFKTLPRAQIAMALQDRDPRSAMSTFMGSEVGASLSPAQVDYVTGLLTMEESAMSLRSIAGQGQGSDTLRHAITQMLPGPTTPSKSYANRQMELFDVELKALRKAVPSSDKLGMGKDIPPPPSPKGSTTRFTDGGRTYNIPSDQVTEFKKDHPNAASAR